MNINGLANRLAPTSQLVELALNRCKTLERLNLFTNRLSDIASHETDSDISLRDVEQTINEVSSSAASSLISSSATPRLTGIPISIKDNFCTLDFPTTCGSKMLSDFCPPYDATVVARLKAEGATIIGKNNMDEFAMGSGSTDSCFGPAVNPWSFRKEIEALGGGGGDESTISSLNDALSRAITDQSWHVSGGSSGGSAGAVAAGLVVAAIGSDTGGSTRVPASHCGVVGLKPTYGRISRHGLIPLVNSLDVPGILTRSVDDAALILNVLSGADETSDSTSVIPDDLEEVVIPPQPSVGGFTVGIPEEYFHPSLHPRVAAVWREITQNLQDAGARIVPVSLPHSKFSIVTYSVLCCCEVASNMARFDGLRFGHRDKRMNSTEAMYALSRSFGFNSVVRGRILAGNFFLSRRNYERYFVKALKVRRLITEELFAALTPGMVDVLLTPTTPAPPLTFREFSSSSNRERMVEADVFTQAVNLAGLPAVSVPVALSEGEEGMPIGLQIIGQPFHEEEILKVAKWIENLAQFPHLPSLHL